MGRPPRNAPGDFLYHCLNRANGRQVMFKKPEDFHAFEEIIAEMLERVHMRMLAYCLMPNHWHLVLWPRQDGDLSEFMRLISVTHAHRWHAHRGSTGSGHLYQGRFKSFIVQDDAYFLTVCRYVERNALRAGLVQNAEDWQWSSLWMRQHDPTRATELLSPWPVERPRNWIQRVNRAEMEQELAALRASVNRGTPYGNDHWVHRTVGDFGLASTLRPRGRPRRTSPSEG